MQAMRTYDKLEREARIAAVNRDIMAELIAEYPDQGPMIAALLKMC